MNRTRIGLAMRALASDRNISAAIGVRVAQTDSIAWLINGAFAGIAGILSANINRLDPGLLTFLVVPAIASAILARLSSLPGAFIGGMVCGHDRSDADRDLARHRQHAQRRSLHRRR